jgi:hypothetical protein
VLRYGAYGPEVIERLVWMRDVLGPAFAAALRAHGPVDIKALVGQMVQMGDEGHNRNRGGTLMLLRDLLPAMVEHAGLPSAELARVARFVGGNDHFFLNLVMAAGKLQSLAAADLPGSTVVTVMARNGTDFGIQVAGTGSTWFTGPAGTVEGLYLGAYGPEDANPGHRRLGHHRDRGPRRLRDGHRPRDRAVRRRHGARRDARHPPDVRDHRWPRTRRTPCRCLDFRGAATGIDVTRVVRTGICPRSTPASPAASPAPARSAPASSPSPSSASCRPPRTWRRPPLTLSTVDFFRDHGLRATISDQRWPIAHDRGAAVRVRGCRGRRNAGHAAVGVDV